MTKYISALILMTVANFCHAQISPNSAWVWMKGDNVTMSAGIYGTQGIPDDANKPGAREGAVSWTDNNGNLWLFGGGGLAENNTSGLLNDLWKYTVSTNQLTWMHGTKQVNSTAVYGTRGVPDPANRPAALTRASAWTDNAGKLWLFGGYSLGYNDLWKYDPDINQWTWVNGDHNAAGVYGIYGTQGVPAATNRPGERSSATAFKDASGNFWIFGGSGYGTTTVGYLNDLWKYDPTTDQWTWMKGDQETYQVGVYGTIGIANQANKPGTRGHAVGWTDNNGNLWLHGGYGLGAAPDPGAEAPSGQDNLNDLWKYDPLTNQWTWMKGHNMPRQPGSYGTQGVPANANTPGARSTYASWKDVAGDLWLACGVGLADSWGNLNDVWKYEVATNRWAWVKGDNSNLSYSVSFGTQGVVSATNKPPKRNSLVAWYVPNGDMWMFGGNIGPAARIPGLTSNDLWRLIAIQNAPLPIQLNEFRGVLNNKVVKLTWSASQAINFSHFNVERSFDGIQFNALSFVNSTSGNTNTIYNYDDIDLQNQQAEKVFYRLQMNDRDGSSKYSRIIRFDLSKKINLLTVFPNPVNHSLNVSFVVQKPGSVIFSITDMKGRIVKRIADRTTEGRVSMAIDVSSLLAGTYVLAAEGAGLKTKIPFIKQ